MDVLITGGAGFLGQRLIARLLADGRIALDDDDRARSEPVDRIVCLDRDAGALRDERLSYVVGDVADGATLAPLVGARPGAIVHLAAVVSGTAEADLDLGLRVNVDGTRALLHACRSAGHVPRLLFASSVAVFGGDLPPVVTDATTPTPQGSYGTHKLIGELLVQDFTRRGIVDGRSVRVPTVVVRPGKPNGAASGFASSIVREPLAGRDAILPVPPATEMWVASPRAVATMLLHALALAPRAWGWHRSLNLPGLVVSMHEAIEALRAVAGDAAAARIRHEPDPAVMRLVGTWAARFDTARARSMGFVADPDFATIVRAHVEDHPDEVAPPAQRAR